jgi:hypothetical protein
VATTREATDAIAPELYRHWLHAHHLLISPLMSGLGLSDGVVVCGTRGPGRTAVVLMVDGEEREARIEPRVSLLGRSAHRRARDGSRAGGCMSAAFLLDYCASEGLTPAALALASLLHPSRVMLAIPGTSPVTHVEENRQGALVRLTDEHFAALSAAV